MLPRILPKTPNNPPDDESFLDVVNFGYFYADFDFGFSDEVFIIALGASYYGYCFSGGYLIVF